MYLLISIHIAIVYVLYAWYAKYDMWLKQDTLDKSLEKIYKDKGIQKEVFDGRTVWYGNTPHGKLYLDAAEFGENLKKHPTLFKCMMMVGLFFYIAILWPYLLLSGLWKWAHDGPNSASETE